ncbi:hypothetical protein MMC14_006705 [Varicellaria rhodocarpa]|nr:hypothetical protein [Varicellaria rhodocarpa]
MCTDTHQSTFTQCTEWGCINHAMEDDKDSMIIKPEDAWAADTGESDPETWVPAPNTAPIDNDGILPLPPTWNEECDHYIVYHRHAPTVCLIHKSYETIYENVTGVYPWLRRGFYKTFEAHLNKLSEETKDGELMLPIIAEKDYWWVCELKITPSVRRNPRRQSRGNAPESYRV